MTKQYFPSALNLQTALIDNSVLRWAWNEGLFESPSELERCRIQKINWFAGYLFSGESAGNLELIMKFFLGLFLLDDLLDDHPDPNSLDFLEKMKKSTFQVPKNRLEILGNQLLELNERLAKSVKNTLQKEKWNESWENYLQGLQWEVKNKIDGKIPALSEYRFFRPYASGVFLAIQLAGREYFTDGCDSQLLESEIARFICLSNDLSSFDKEYAIGDFHNEVFILSGFLGDEAKSWANKEIKLLRRKIEVLGNQVGSKSDSCQRWVENLFLLVGGCLAWSEETARYVTYVNGALKTS